MVGMHDDLTTPTLPIGMKAVKKALVVVAMSTDESGRVLRRFVKA